MGIISHTGKNEGKLSGRKKGLLLAYTEVDIKFTSKSEMPTVRINLKEVSGVPICLDFFIGLSY